MKKVKGDYASRSMSDNLEDLAKRNKSYCPAAFREIYVDGSGQYKPCCYFGKNDDLKKYKDDTTLPFEFFFSKEMEDMRNKMYAGEPIKGCETCVQMEKRVGSSYRTKRYIRKFNFVSDIEDIQLKLRVNGSYCNLGCYMCFPNNSSTRRNELTAVYGKDYNKMSGFEKPYNAVKHEQWNKIMNNIVENIDLVGYIKMTGGEPLQLPKHWEFIDRIPDDAAKRIMLSYDTNYTKIRYKNRSIYEVVDKFKNVHIGVSCDHFGDKLKWIRYPIDVKEFEDNLKEAGHLVNYLNCTVSILNVFDILEIQKYYRNNFNLLVTFHNIARGPQMLSICNLPYNIKQELIEKYKDFPFVVDELKKPSWGLYEKGLEYCQKLSDHRGFQFRELWPEL